MLNGMESRKGLSPYTENFEFFYLKIVYSIVHFMHNARNSGILSPQSEQICPIYYPYGCTPPLHRLWLR